MDRAVKAYQDKEGCQLKGFMYVHKVKIKISPQEFILDHRYLEISMFLVMRLHNRWVYSSIELE